MSFKGTAGKMLLPLVMFFLSGIFQSVYAQDVLILKSGREMKVIITEETSDVIRYREYENSSGPLYSIDKTKVESVKYSKKKLNTKDENPVMQPAQAEVAKDDPSLTVKKRYVMQNGRILSTRQVKTIMEDYPKSLELYTKGRKQCSSSNGCAFGIIGVCMVANLATNKMEGGSKMAILGTALGISGGLAITGAVLASSGKKKIRQAVDIYNTGVSKPVSYQLNLQLSPSGIGVALRF